MTYLTVSYKLYAFW